MKQKKQKKIDEVGTKEDEQFERMREMKDEEVESGEETDPKILYFANLLFKNAFGEDDE
jgi:hypothetical protein